MPDELVELELDLHGQTIRQHPFGELLRIERAVDG
jgi:hypothetical protein